MGGVTHNYTLEGTKILRETYGGYTIVPLYDSDNNVCGITYNNDMFLLMKNLQGDVISIADENGTTVALYSYDAWGSPVTLPSSGSLLERNPFRYRGYMYDTETGLYYLQSRYYDPATGRFINADSAECIGANETILSYNLYVYCENNPVMNSDPSGYMPQVIAQVLFGMITSAFIYTVSLLGRYWYKGFYCALKMWSLRDFGSAVLSGAIIGLMGPMQH